MTKGKATILLSLSLGSWDCATSHPLGEKAHPLSMGSEP